MLSVIETPLWLSVGEIDETVGAVVSIIKGRIVKKVLPFPAESVTLKTQSVYVPSLKALRVTVIVPAIAEVVLEEQEPPYVMVPASEDVIIKSGVVSLVGVLISLP